MIYIVLPIFIILGITLYMAAFFFWLFCFRNKVREYLAISISCLGMVSYDIFSIGLYLSTTVVEGVFWQRGQFFSMLIFGVSLIYYVHHHTGSAIRMYENIYSSILTVLACAVWLPFPFVFDINVPNIRTFLFFNIPVTYYEAQAGIVIIIYYCLILIGFTTYFIRLLLICLKDKSVSSFVLAVSFSLFFFSGFLDILNSLGFFRFVYTLEYSFFIIAIAFTFNSMRRFVSLHNQVETMNVALEAQVKQRTVELENKNRELESLSERDGLTMIYNHLAIHKRIQMAYNESSRHVFPMSLVMIDIDNFKMINDMFGHPSGDGVLKALVDASQNSIRNYDSVGRYGGDEFLICLLYCGVKEATAIAERIRLRFKEFKFHDYSGLTPTISIGIAVQNEKIAGNDATTLIRLADHAMYESKKTGKDRVSIRVLE